MQDPGDTLEVPPSSSPPKRRRQERTVYTAEQQQELKKCFKINRYPTYQDRQALADRLKLQEHQVQVWFKNQRAKFSKLQRLSRGRGRKPGVLHSGCRTPAVAGALRPPCDTAFAQVHPPVNPMIPGGPDYSKMGPPTLAPSNIGPAFQGGSDFSNPGTPALAPSIVPPVFPGGQDFSNLGTPALAPSTVGPMFPGGSDFCCQGAPTLAPSSAGPMFPGDILNPGAPALAPSTVGPALLDDSDFCSPYLPRPSAIFPPAEPCVSSEGPAWVCPAQGIHVSVPATPDPPPGPASAPAPAWPPASYVACFSSESGVTTNFPSVLSSLDPSEGPPSSSSSTCSFSGHREGDSFVTENDSDPKMLLNL